jgi:hypothetical protein
MPVRSSKPVWVFKRKLSAVLKNSSVYEWIEQFRVSDKLNKLVPLKNNNNKEVAIDLITA